MALTDNQLLLLNLLYSGEDTGLIETAPGSGTYPAQGKTVGEVAREMLSKLEKRGTGKEYDFKTRDQMETALKAILADDTLSRMEIAAAKREDGGSLHFIVVTPEGSGPREAVVVYQGTTGAEEWRDDFEGGGPTSGSDGVSTPCQEKMLDFYQQHKDILDQCDYVTTTGHSKGGNAAQYVALMDTGVDRCVSFDGQGFSDEFMKKYADTIAARQDLILNYSADGDYVDILLNHVGTSIYIKSTIPSEGNVAWYHSPYTMMDMDDPARSLDRQVPQSRVTAELDKLLNSYIRSLDPADRKAAMEMFGQIAAECLSGDVDPAELIHLLSEGSNPEQVGRLLSFVMQYVMETGRKEIVREALNWICPGFGDTVIGFYEAMMKALDNPLLQGYMMLRYGSLHLAGHLLEVIGWLIEQDWFRELLSIFCPEAAKLQDTLVLLTKAFGAAFKYAGTHKIPSGADMSVSGSSAPVISMDFALLESTAATLKNLAASLSDSAGAVSRAAAASRDRSLLLVVVVSSRFKLLRKMGYLIGTPANVLERLGRFVSQYASKAEELAGAVSDSATLSREMEGKNAANFSNLMNSFGGV